MKLLQYHTGFYRLTTAILIAVCFCAVTRVSAQEVEHYQGTMLIHLRGHDEPSMMMQHSLSSRAGTEIAERYMFVVPSIQASFVAAAEGMRRTNHPISQQSIRAFLVPAQDVQALILLPTDDCIEIVITTGLLDVVEATSYAILAEAVAQRRTGLDKAAEGFDSWLAELQRRGGQPCDTRVPWPVKTDIELDAETRSLVDSLAKSHPDLVSESPSDNEAVFILTRVLAHSLMQFILGHELAHCHEGPSDGSRFREEQCDRLAFHAMHAMGSAQIDTVILTLVVLAHYQNLQGPFIHSEIMKTLQGQQYLEVRSGHDWQKRAASLLEVWENGYDAHNPPYNNPMYLDGWEDQIQSIREYVTRPLPEPCSVESTDYNLLHRIIAVDFEDIEWNANGKPPIVDYAYRLTNVHPTAAARFTFQVYTGYEPRDDSSDTSGVHKLKRYSLELQPGENRRISDTLEWWRDANTMPVLREGIVDGTVFGHLHATGFFSTRDIDRVKKAIRQTMRDLSSGEIAAQVSMPRFETRSAQYYDLESAMPLSSDAEYVARVDGRHEVRFDYDALSDQMSGNSLRAMATQAQLIDSLRGLLPCEANEEYRARTSEDFNRATTIGILSCDDYATLLEVHLIVENDSEECSLEVHIIRRGQDD